MELQHTAAPHDNLAVERQALAARLGGLAHQRAALADTRARASAGQAATRRAAVAALAGYPFADVRSDLLTALGHKDVETRAAAAGALGLIGDDSVIQPLLSALRASFVGHSAAWNVVFGWSMAGLLLVMGLSLIWGIAALKLGGMVWVFTQLLRHVGAGITKRRRERGGANRAVIEALLRIGERSPTPELRAALPDLRAVSADVVQQDFATRNASRRATQRIDALTEELQNLPLAAAAAAPATEALPRPAEAPQPDVAQLPRAG